MVKKTCVESDKKNAEKTRQTLLSKKLLDADYPVTSDKKNVYFPVKKNPPKSLKTVEKNLPKKNKKPKSLSEALGTKLSKKQLGSLKKSFDILGDIAIIEIPPELRKKEKQIGEALLAVHSNLKTVAKKQGPVHGKYRTRRLKIIAGENKKQTTYTENGCRFQLDAEKVYFSPRLGTERQRIAKQVKAGERIAALFAGVGPYPIVIKKTNPRAGPIVAVELNPEAVKYMRKNILLNKASGIKVVEGDVKKVVPKQLKNWADRVIMPLPKGAENFLKEAIISAKKNAIIHFYHFSQKQKPFEKAVRLVKESAQLFNRKAKIINKKKVRPYSPTTCQVVLDARIT